MEKIWYIEIEGRTEGPYSLLDLKREARLTPDTLVWREGFSKWVPIRAVPELKEVFADESAPSNVDSEDETDEQKEKEDNGVDESLRHEIVLRYSEDFPPFLLWLFIVFCLMVYIYYRLQSY